MTSVIALSPGTMTVDVERGSSTIYVHFFRCTTSTPPANNSIDSSASWPVRSRSLPTVPPAEVPEESP